MKKTTKIVINTNYGGFHLSPQAVKYLVLRNSKLIMRLSIDQYNQELSKIVGEELSKITQREWEKRRQKIQNEFSVDLGDGFKGHRLYPDIAIKGNIMYIANINKSQRTHPDLIAVVEELGDEASYKYSRLCIVEIPADIEWEIGNYIGMEWIAEKHRKWFCNETHKKMVCG